jgi:hypothetical protein
VSGDKEGGIWFVDRTTPGGGGGDGTCTGGANANVETYPINGTGLSLTGPVIHNSPAYWKGGTTTESHLFITSQFLGGPTGAGQLMRYQLCTQGKPIRNSTSPACTTTGAYAYETTGTPLPFAVGATPAISASGNSATDAVVWAIWADGSDIPAAAKFTDTKGQVFPQAQPGRLYAFDADNANDPNMGKLYSSRDCLASNGSQLDHMNPATKFSVPTVANGYVYVGTQGPLCSDSNFPTDGSTSCFNSGTFYVFGAINPARTCN